jgi:SAM-dependent methyltransferase
VATLEKSPEHVLHPEDTMSRNIHLGCGYVHLDGWLNVDKYATSATDMCFDLEEAWPLDTSSQAQLYASHVLEHLTRWDIFFQQAWRVLQPGGRLTLRVPYGGHPAAWWDMGHIRPWFIENFVYFHPGYSAQIGNVQHADWQWPFHIERIDVRIGNDFVKVLRRLPFRWMRQLVLPLVRHSALAIEELFVFMRPLKSQEEVQQWLALHAPNVLHSQYTCWKHQWEGRMLAPGEEATLHTLGIAVQLNGYN